tara:strand:- start:6684 stop:8906 length:2223 start_codon:yes stop_codon:yes gene_type:complete
MAVWYTIAGTADKTSGTDLNGTHINFTITPVNPDTGIHSGAYLNALNFKIGGATEVDGSGDAATDTGIWSGGNVDTGVSKVEFTDNGLTGDINNTVNVKVTFGSTTPTNNASYFVDVDEKTTNPISYSANRNVCFKVQLPYNENLIYEFYEAGVGPQTFTSQAATGGDITRTLLNPVTYETDGFYTYQFSGTINNYDEDHSYDIVRVLARRAYLGNTLDPLPGVGDPNFDIHDFFINWPPSVTYNYGMDYPSLYMFAYQVNEHIHNYFHNNMMLPIAYHMDISYNPSDYDFIREYEQGGMCSLGHQVYLNIQTTDPTPEEENPEVTEVIVDTVAGEEGGYQEIVVNGTPGAEYEIQVIQTESTTSDNPKATGAFYNLSGSGGFQTNKPTGSNFFVLNSSNTHRVLLPPTTSDVKYNVVVTPRNNTTARSTVPTVAGSKSTLQQGVSTITLQATARVPANFDLTTSAADTRQVFTRKKRGTSSVGRRATVVSEVLSAVSSGRRIELRRADARLTEGMYVIQPFGTGVSHKTKITRVNRNIITVNEALTLSAGDELNFVAATPNIIPFQVKAKAGQGSDSDYQNLSVQTGASYKPQDVIGGVGNELFFTVNGGISGTTITVDEEISGVKVGMRVTGKGLVSIKGQKFATVESINESAKQITVDSSIKLVDNQTISVQDDPDNPVSTAGIEVLHVMGIITTSDADPANNQEECAINGYLDVSNVSQTATIPVYLESVILAEEV